MKVRQGGTVLEAFRWTGGRDQEEEPDWAVEALRRGRVSFENELTQQVKLRLHTSRGVVIVNRGDWIIREQDGELASCSPAAFQERYEQLSPPDTGGVLGTLRRITVGRRAVRKRIN